ncbi:hypothetical protein [Pseudofrankia sp. DC12]|uniref:hypothetical protein n=1 Tax=Pseudofrankia sp. DC12 TaxID=683315 RepID=UPI0005F80123|nr:hypothetical protein [Pseudofrankia sp. DC12]
MNGASKGNAWNMPKKGRPTKGKAKSPDKGRPDNHNKREPQIVVRVGVGHPRFEPGTFDARALLTSVLATVEPRLDERLSAVADAALGTGADAEGLTRAIQTTSRQIADAVRSGVIDGMRARDRHLAQLVVIDRAAAHAGSLTELRTRIEQELERAGLRRISDLADVSSFNLVETATGSSEAPKQGQRYELVSPAYVDAETGHTIERGWIRTAPDEASPPGGKLHGRSSRAHRTPRRTDTDEPTTVDEAATTGREEAP